jgi:S1-C subfamily serine protease
MKKLVLLCILLCNCAYYYRNYLPREAFLKIGRMTTIQKCIGSNCDVKNLYSVGSGSLVAKAKKDGYVLTAGHVCINIHRLPDEYQFVSYKLKTIDIEGNVYDAGIVSVDIDTDVCILKIKNIKYMPIRISKKSPIAGDKIINIAAPGGFFDKDMIPIYSGFYSGRIKSLVYNYDIYSVWSYPGSSGSMIVNERHELVGIVVAGFVEMNTVTFSPTYDDIVKFVKEVMEKDCKDCKI